MNTRFLNARSASWRARHLGVALTAASLLALGASMPARAADAETVRIDNFTFSPATLTVHAGQRVTWINGDDEPHTVTSASDPRAFASGALDTDGTFAFTFDKPGTYPYFCAIHPHMTGVIVVK
ncbi:putative Amicyanin precursor [Pandoraea morbifera]|uniref:Putative Amicyanin n=1 Tax=Pandoraea morbifera TaxID=2508300 RepID=A0A5E4RRB0_9BURK|nr:cupredoxin family copper-binding protein [Pandoraea morbifera]VVD65946.1 putative Amicyanin precursor [Pandoraea morbifera]